MTKPVLVFMWPEIPVGKLWCRTRGGRESASFEYDPVWLGLPERFALEPGLNLGKGSFHSGKTPLFGALGDSAPDRWGRVLMRRREERRERAAGEHPRTLTELDYMLGINDEARQGALRFRETTETPFLASPEQNAIPPLLALPKLLSATERFLESRESDEDLQMLLAPGSSLGGARPKASVYDRGDLSIAKFPRKDDEFQTILWEALALSLAGQAGIRLPSWRIEQVLNKPVLILKRFDRQGVNRIPFLSAMSMLGAADNEQHSYLEIAWAINRYGADPQQDLEELWRRLVFNICISNTDDHLRNHGFLYVPSRGWRLSPAYDMNPVPRTIGPHVLSLAIDITSCEASLETALSVTDEFRLKQEKALSIISEVKQVVRNWQQTARSLGINRQESEQMTSAFCFT